MTVTYEFPKVRKYIHGQWVMVTMCPPAGWRTPRIEKIRGQPVAFAEGHWEPSDDEISFRHEVGNSSDPAFYDGGRNPDERDDWWEAWIETEQQVYRAQGWTRQQALETLKDIIRTQQHVRRLVK